MNFLFIMICILAFFAWIWPNQTKTPAKKFGEGMFADTDTKNWQPPL